ncbi:hypothetical protein BJV78DRAFT_1158497 [Lactifluus subvellereus]|nr:hypothetical protein BJV78DRAFT_1158497 [Lactifluus subvellereus]
MGRGKDDAASIHDKQKETRDARVEDREVMPPELSKHFTATAPQGRGRLLVLPRRHATGLRTTATATDTRAAAWLKDLQESNNAGAKRRGCGTHSSSRRCA